MNGTTEDKSFLKLKVVIKIATAAAIFTALCALAAVYAPKDQTGSPIGLWYSIIPPLTAILLAFVTGRVYLSLAIAIITGGLLTAIPQAPLSAAAWGHGTVTAGSFVAKALTTKSNLQILSFIPPIFVMITLILASGGFSGAIRLLLRWAKGRRSVQLATFLMGLICFIDDYTNAMIIGSAMRPVTDRFGVSREKLAFLVDATSAPITGLAVISTWIAYEVGLIVAIASQLGIEKDGYSIFFDALPFRFYCIIMIGFVFLNIVSGCDFGPMRTAQKRSKDSKAQAPDEMLSDMGTIEQGGQQPRAIIALLPLGVLVIFNFVGLWLSGDGPAKLNAGGSLLDWVYWRSVIADVNNTTIILFYSALAGFSIALICARFLAALSLTAIYKCFRVGLKRSLIPLIILTLAWSLKNCCDALNTGTFLASLLADSLSPLWFPALLFVTASVVSFAIGTSYGTMAILIPTAIPVAFALDGESYGLITIISFGSVLDGAIFGDHCSPISDTTIMSSISSSCDLMKHVRTQLPYSLFVAALALTFGYIPGAFGIPSLWSIGAAVLLMVVFFAVLAHRQKLSAEN